MMSATASIIANVSTYCTSATWKDMRGGMKKKLKATMLSSAASTAAPRLKRMAITTTASRYTMAMFTGSKRSCIASPARVQAAVATKAHA